MNHMDISMSRNRSGTRLAYVIVPLEGNVERAYTIWTKKDGLKTIMKKEPAGFMVYFPRGHAIRVRNKEDLAFHGLNVTDIPMCNVQGLNDPRSAVGRLLTAQNDRTRKEAMLSLEDKTIRLATAKTGNVLMPEQIGQGFRLEEQVTGEQVAV